MNATDQDSHTAANAWPWHHCGRCDQFFQATDADTCPHCDASPVIDEAEMAFFNAEQESGTDDPLPGYATATISQSTQHVHPSRAARMAKNPHRKKNGLVIFVIAWVALLSLVLVGVQLTRSGEEKPTTADDGLSIEQAERQRLLHAAYLECQKVVMEFMQDRVPERRIQHIHNPNETLPKLTRTSNSAPTLSDPKDITSEFFEFFELPDGETAIQSRWATNEGDRLEIVFYKNPDDRWVIDWENLVRWSADSWSIFLTEDEEVIKTFRVYARRPASETGGTGVTDRVRLLEPKPWNPSKAGRQSPQIFVDPDSEMGRILEAAFEQRESERGVFGTRLSQDDPKSMIRLHARIRREPGERIGRPKFHLEEILTCHWLSIDDLGVEPELPESVNDNR